jgi:CDP-glycerol glycerophosphotransferase (TagB/SpsB family)
MHLEFNIRRAKALKENNNIKLILKKHPDRLEESKGIYDEYYDELVTRPFEDVYDDADLFIFSEISTTTFGFAVMTNKPIIIFSDALKFVWNDVERMLRKRCIVIESSLSTDGKLMFDSISLMSALNSTLPLPNKDYIHKYILGHNNEN